MILKGKRVFIVEDNLGNRAIAQLLLEQSGAKVAFERWGVDTIHKLRRFAPVDIILLDLMFPRGVTGYDIFKLIRKHAEFNHVPIVAVSASDASEAIPLTQELGFNGFISKPIEFRFFAGQVARAIEGEEIWQSPSHV